MTVICAAAYFLAVVLTPSAPVDQDPFVRAYLYNPTQDHILVSHPYNEVVDTLPLAPTLSLEGEGLPDGTHSLKFEIRDGVVVLHGDQVDVTPTKGRFEAEVVLEKRYPGANGVSWSLATGEDGALRGMAPLEWSRFRGRVEYESSPWRDTFVMMVPLGWGRPGLFYVPVESEGRFDVLVPRRVYAAVAVAGGGYVYDALERWAWDYDLTRDREDSFALGRVELYGMRAFDIRGGPKTVFVMFRPSALSRVLRWDSDGDGFVGPEEQAAMGVAMRDSATVIGPELEAEDVTVWLDGVEEPIVQFNRIPEYDGDSWQIQYLLQIYPEETPARWAWHEIRLEVRSREEVGGERVIDFGEGTVGYFRR